MDDTLNDLFVLLHEREKDTPARRWANGNAMHPAIFRALKLDRNETGAIFAAQPFRLYRGEDGVRVLFAHPAPRILGPVDDDWCDVETVVSWNPVDNSACIMGDEQAQTIGECEADDDEGHVFTDPFAYFRATAEMRARWYVKWQVMKDEWHVFREPRFSPGLLAVGSIESIRWPMHRMPRHVVCHGFEHRILNRALLRQAHIPHARRSTMSLAA